MAKDKLTEYSATNASNDVIGDISVAEGMLPSAVNNALREQMTHLKNFSDGTDGIDVLSLDDDDASASIKIQAPSAVTTTTTLTLPDGDGDAGAMLQTNGSGQLAWSTAYRNRNLILNGAMAISQRGISQTGVSSGGAYRNAPDRFRFGLSSAGTWTVSQDSDAPVGFANSYKLDCTTADASLSAGDYIELLTGFEGQDLQQLEKGTSSAQAVTLSFWCKSNKTGTYIVNIQDTDNGRTIAKSYTVSTANTWEYQSLSFVGDTSGALDNDNAQSLRAKWWFAAGSTYTSGTLATSWEANTAANYAVGQVNLADSTDNYFNITGVQLEVGEQATPFEHRSFGDELAACQRYYQQIGGQTPANVLCVGQCTSSTLAQFFIPFIVPVRADPTCSVSDQTHFRVFNAAVSGIPDTTNMTIAATNAASYGSFRIVATVGSGLSAGNATMLSGSDSDGNAGIIKMDAEL